MAQVTIRINGYAYTVGCEDGQEPHLQAMGRAVDGYVDRVKALGKHSGESQILVLASLLMADELHDAALAPPPPAPQPVALPVHDAAAATPGRAAGVDLPLLRELAERAEDIASMLERD